MFFTGQAVVENEIQLSSINTFTDLFIADPHRDTLSKVFKKELYNKTKTVKGIVELFIVDLVAYINALLYLGELDEEEKEAKGSVLSNLRSSITLGPG